MRTTAGLLLVLLVVGGGCKREGGEATTVDFTVEELNALTDQVMKKDELRRKRIDAEHAPVTTRQDEGKTTFSHTFQFLPADIKKTDSAVNPLVGEISYRVVRTIANDLYPTINRRIEEERTARVVKKDGKWVVVKATTKIIADTKEPTRVGETTDETLGFPSLLPAQ